VSEFNKDWDNHRPTVAEVEARKAFGDEKDNGPMAAIRKAVITGTYMPEWSQPTLVVKQERPDGQREVWCPLSLLYA
jgi:hypothetical protein